MASQLRRRANRRAQVVTAVVGLAIVVGIWELVVIGLRPPAVKLPPPAAVFATLGHLLASSAFRTDVLVSLRRVVLGWAIGSTAGILVGSLAGLTRLGKVLLEPSLRFLRFIVPFAWVPIASVFFGLSEAGKLFITSYASFFIVAFMAVEGVRAVDPGLIDAGRLLGVNGRMRQWASIRLPAAGPEILTGIKIGIGFSWISLLVAEMVNATNGIGVVLYTETQYSDTARVLALVIVIGVIGAALNLGVASLAARLPWTSGSR
ncbi:MAG TPA: ABC transporter permease [Acidimicrobiales bacterium]|nr:ABC transporter permease [Acidimicrobiales bacterium]